MIRGSSVIPSDAEYAAAGLCLRLLDGPLAGSGWPLGAQPILMGRGLGCQIRLDDSQMSREQCEVSMVQNQPRLRHLSQKTATLLNGVAVQEAALALGDIIEVGGYIIIVDVMSQAERSSGNDDTGAVTTPTPSGRVRKRSHVAPAGSEAELVQDLALLEDLILHLANGATLDALSEILARTVRRDLGAAALWFVRYLDAGNHVVLHPPSTREQTHVVPMRLLRDVCRSGECAKSTVPGEGPILACPLIHRKSVFGAVGIQLSVVADAEALLARVQRIAERVAPVFVTAEVVDKVTRRDASLAEPDGLLGISKCVDDLRARIRRAALARANVLITGETGVGKDLAARAIHGQSKRASGPFVAINCAAIPSELFESEMFGHEPGAFTGASSRRIGLMEQAHGGTLFLDEIGDLSLTNQARILRAVETGCFRRIGAKADLQVDVRIISATNRALPDSSQSYFRHDLYHRLATLTVHVPPLRERKDDVPILAQHFLDQFWAYAPAHPRTFTGGAMAVLCGHDWPGNVRELRNIVERACYEAHGPTITDAELGVISLLPESAAALDVKPLEEVERAHLITILEMHNWRVADVAKALKLSRGTVYYKLAKLGITTRPR